jgi:hypothetical protein
MSYLSHLFNQLGLILLDIPCGTCKLLGELSFQEQPQLAIWRKSTDIAGHIGETISHDSTTNCLSVGLANSTSRGTRGGGSIVDDDEYPAPCAILLVAMLRLEAHNLQLPHDPDTLLSHRLNLLHLQLESLKLRFSCLQNGFPHPASNSPPEQVHTIWVLAHVGVSSFLFALGLTSVWEHSRGFLLL